MQCPYLSVNSGKNVCKIMVEQGLDAEVSNFDIEHYCQNNPVFCYYFRNASRCKTEGSDVSPNSMLSRIFKTS